VTRCRRSHYRCPGSSAWIADPRGPQRWPRSPDELLQSEPYIQQPRRLCGGKRRSFAAGTNGATDLYVTNPTQVILDINGYFAP
jgi:hypothetical protein